MTTVRRSRAEQVEANDWALRTATVDITVESGWEAVTFAGVADRAGLTVGAVYGRAENTAELGIDVWNHVAGPWFADSVNLVIGAGRAGDIARMHDALTHWDTSPRMSSLVFELLVASHFDADMSEVIAADASRTLSAHMLPSTSTPKVTRHEAAAAVLTVSFAFGRAIGLRGGARQPAITDHQSRVQANMFGADPLRKSLPVPQPLSWVRSLDDFEPAHRALLRGTLDVVGRVGYKRATIAKIARAAGLPRGSVLSHYEDKAHLLADAVRNGLIPPGEVWSQYAPVVDRYGPFTSRAMFLADFLKEENRTLWTVNLELTRIARLLPLLEGFRPSGHVLENTHLGVMLTASLLPNLADLPYAGPFNAGSAT